MNCQCPNCHSNGIRVQYPDISCISCGHNDSLMDFAISHEHHRALCLEYGRPVPVACALNTRQIIEQDPWEEMERAHIPQLNREQIGQLQQIHGEVYYLKNKLTEHLAKKKRDRL